MIYATILISEDTELTGFFSVIVFIHLPEVCGETHLDFIWVYISLFYRNPFICAHVPYK